MSEGRPIGLDLLGGAALRVEGDWPRCPARGLRLLAVLALDGPQPRRQVADLLWSGGSGRVLHNLRTTLYSLRRVLGQHADVLTERGHQLHLARVEVDVLGLTSADLALEGTWREFMAGHRADGPEQWLEWAERTEMRLLGHLQPLPARRRLPPVRQGLDLAQEALAAAQQDRPGEAESAAHAALTLTPRGEGAALALDVLTHQAIERDEYTLARDYCGRALRATPEPQPDICYTAGYLADLLGEPSRAEHLALLGLAHLAPGRSPALWYATVASAHDSRQDFRAARLWHELALQAARAAPSAQDHCGVLTFYLWHLNATGDSARAQMLAAEALDQGDFSMTAYIHQSLGTAQFRLGELGEALRTLQVNRTHPVLSLRVIAASLEARILHRQGDREGAQALLRGTLPLARTTEDGRARFEWAVAALTCAPREWAAQADACVRGAQTNDPLIVRQYQRLRAGLPTPTTPA
ncbi:hypothetical protein QOL99_15105 [Deinococcus sp. MIMF12]|uniref:Transcriptional regulator n=1 Tax=Deinococcus rhizophilus TaxID=3049544 RepID=A0ABT7JLX7_9DEIO|nr:hypothetical protein [Deinococcus rhizophilus]MDL2345468.1 hypothetical protein [Deinococcus rhizophilus]